MNPTTATVHKAATTVAGVAMTAAGALLGYIALAIVLGLVGYDLGAWRGALLMLALLFALTAASLIIAAAVLRARAKQQPEAAGPDATAAPGGSTDQEWLAPLALGVAAATAIGPLRVLRLGLRAYSLWVTVRSLTKQGTAKSA